MRHVSIRTKLAIGLSLLLLASFAAINVINYLVSKASVRNSIITESLPSISDNIYLEIHKSLLVPTHVSSLMANDTFIKDWILDGEEDMTRIIKYLRVIKYRYGFDSAFLISDRTGRYYHYQGVQKIISPDDPHDVWYYQFMAMDVNSDLDVDTDQAAANRLTIFINHRLEDYSGNFLGVTGVGLSMDSIGQLFHDIQTAYHKTVYMVDDQGLVQLHPDSSLVGSANIRDMPGLAENADIVLTPSDQPTLVEYDADHRHMLLMARYIPEFNWFLMVEQDEGQAMGGLKSNFVRNLGIGFLVTAAVIVINVMLVNHFQGRLEQMAQTDELTGLNNRRHFMTLARHDFAQHTRNGRPLALLMIDADHFKTINDDYGHEQGDQALRSLASIMKQELREADLPARFGGEEFVVLMPGTNLENAVNAAERMRKAVQEQSRAALPLTLTVSVGVAAADSATKTIEHLIHKADTALYKAKQDNRNCVRTA